MREYSSSSIHKGGVGKAIGGFYFGKKIVFEMINATVHVFAFRF